MIKFIGRKTELRRRDSSTAYFEFDGRFFPHQDYTDFDRFIEIWSNDLTENGSKDLVTFFDAPYAFEVKKENRNYVFRFFTKFEDGLDQTDEYRCQEGEYFEFLKSLRDFSNYISSIN